MDEENWGQATQGCLVSERRFKPRSVWFQNSCFWSHHSSDLTSCCSQWADQGWAALVQTGSLQGPLSQAWVLKCRCCYENQPSHHLVNASCVYLLAWIWMAKLLTWVRGKRPVWASFPWGAEVRGKVGHLDTYPRTGERQTGFLKRTVSPSLTSGSWAVSAVTLRANAWGFHGILSHLSLPSTPQPHYTQKN